MELSGALCFLLVSGCLTSWVWGCVPVRRAFEQLPWGSDVRAALRTAALVQPGLGVHPVTTWTCMGFVTGLWLHVDWKTAFPYLVGVRVFLQAGPLVPEAKPRPQGPAS